VNRIGPGPVPLDEVRYEMSVIGKVPQEQQTQSSGLTLREAVTTVLVAAVAADGTVAPAEADRLHALLTSMHLFAQVPPDHLQRLIEKARNLVTHIGADELLRACAAVIPGENRASLFALAVELTFVDGTIAEREKQFSGKLQRALAIDDVTAIKIVETMLIKNRACLRLA
jgi:uncharacterized tellurite resistance protein B-like protein